jgi:hypothetical protein
MWCELGFDFYGTLSHVTISTWQVRAHVDFALRHALVMDGRMQLTSPVHSQVQKLLAPYHPSHLWRVAVSPSVSQCAFVQCTVCWFIFAPCVQTWVPSQSVCVNTPCTALVGRALLRLLASMTPRTPSMPCVMQSLLNCFCLRCVQFVRLVSGGLWSQREVSNRSETLGS